jgi:hypothetical protein
MPRASSLLSLSAVLALAGMAPALEMPVIVNGAQESQPAKPAPDAAKTQPPVIINYPSAALQPAPADQKTDAKLPVIINYAAPAAKPGPARFAVAYNVPVSDDYMAPVAYNSYRLGSMYSLDAGMGYGLSAPYAGMYGGYGSGYGYGYGGYVVPAYDAFGPWGYGLYPPLVEVLDSGVRPNAGRLTSMPSVRAPVFGQVIGVYYR